MWYGKGPGVDRSGDVFKHGNAAGTSRAWRRAAARRRRPRLQILDPAAQSEYAFMDASIPVLNPAGVQDILDFGLYGWAMSRYSGCWIAMKTIAETVDSSASVDVDPHRVEIRLPEDFEMPPGGLNIRWPDPPLEQECAPAQLQAATPRWLLPGRNELDRVDARQPAAAHRHRHHRQSPISTCARPSTISASTRRMPPSIGIRLYKVGMSWPLEREGMRHFADGLEEILVVEEKRAVIENQIKEQLYNWPEDVRPRVVGKFDENAQLVMPSHGELTPAQIARVIAQRIRRRSIASPRIERPPRRSSRRRSALGAVPSARSSARRISARAARTTPRPRCRKAVARVAGIGCHYMAHLDGPHRPTTFTQMGGEGVTWIGQAPFTDDAARLRQSRRRHLFPLRHPGDPRGDRVRRQHHLQAPLQRRGGDDRRPARRRRADGAADHPAARGRGRERIVVVTDEPDKYPRIRLSRRRRRSTTATELDAVQRELREIPASRS